MMLTGRSLFSIERQGQRIPPEHVALPEWFRRHGYATAHVGKWHQDRESHSRCFSTGAKIFGFKKKQGWYEACNGHWHVPVHDFDPSGAYDPDGGYNDPAVAPFHEPYTADYYALISFIDEHVGSVLDALEQSGQADNTVIVFSGDNGLAVGQHGLMGKQNLYDHSVRVPLIFAGPGVSAEGRTDAWCYLLDIFPTLCDLAGIPIPDSVEGRTLVPAIRDPSAGIRDELFFGYKDVQRGVRVGSHKLIEYMVNGKRTSQLFDLDSDPREATNLAGDERHADTLARLRKQLRRWESEFGDTGDMGRRFWAGAVDGSI